MARIRERLDRLLSRRDFDGARRHLQYWMSEARACGDTQGELLVLSEYIGFCRKAGDRDGAMESIKAALGLLESIGLKGTITGGTVCVNAATALNAFGENERALQLFERARTAYEAGGADDALLGGLYNNMGLTCSALREYDKAMALFTRALAHMERVAGGAPERAITCLNMANLIEAQVGMEAGESRIYALLDRAAELLDDPAIPHDGYYAFVCEKCAPTFEYYGYFADAARFAEEAERIYAGY